MLQMRLTNRIHRANALFQVDPEVAGMSVRRFDQYGLIQAEREILREVEVQFVYPAMLG